MSIYDALDEAGIEDEKRSKILAAYHEELDDDRERKEKNELAERVTKLEKIVKELAKEQLGGGKKDDDEKKKSKKEDSDEDLIDAIVSDVCCKGCW